MTCAAMLVSTSVGNAVLAQSPTASGLLGASPTYGYYPYQECYGPIYAQRELDYLTFQPGIRGLDYGYGVGYFFGFGPPKYGPRGAELRWVRR